MSKVFLRELGLSTFYFLAEDVFLFVFLFVCIFVWIFVRGGFFQITKNTSSSNFHNRHHMLTASPINHCLWAFEESPPSFDSHLQMDICFLFTDFCMAGKALLAHEMSYTSVWESHHPASKATCRWVHVLYLPICASLDKCYWHTRCLIRAFDGITPKLWKPPADGCIFFYLPICAWLG